MEQLNSIHPPTIKRVWSTLFGALLYNQGDLANLLNRAKRPWQAWGNGRDCSNLLIEFPAVLHIRGIKEMLIIYHSPGAWHFKRSHLMPISRALAWMYCGLCETWHGRNFTGMGRVTFKGVAYILFFFSPFFCQKNITQTPKGVIFGSGE